MAAGEDRQTRRWRRGLAGVSFLGMTCAAAPAEAAAPVAPSCETIVGDVDDLLTPDEERAVGAAAADLASEAGVVVRAHLLRTASASGGVDGYAQDQLDRCGSWQTEAGDARGSFLLLVVATEDRRTATWYGDDLVVSLDPVRDDVHESMVPALRSAAWSDALVTGLIGYHDVLSVVAPPASPPVATVEPPPETLPAIPAPDPVPVDRPTSAESQTNGLVLLAGGLAIGGAAGATVWRRRQKALDQARREAAAVASEVSRGYYDLEDRWSGFGADRMAVASLATQGDRAAVRMTQECDEADEALGHLRNSVLTAPEVDEARKQAEMVEAEATWRRVGTVLADATREVEEAIAATEALRAAAATAPEDLTSGRASLDEARRGLASIQADGFKASAVVELLDRADRILGAAEVALDERRPGDAGAAVETARELVARAGERTVALPALRDEIPRRAAEQDGRADELATRLTDEVEAAHRDLTKTYARTVWDDLADAPDDVRERLAHLRELTAQAVADARMDVQEFDRAAQTLDEADRVLADVAGELDAVVTRLADAREAEAQLDQALADARTAAERSRSFATTRRHRLSRTSEMVLAAAERELEDAERAAETRPLDPLRSLHAAFRAEEEITQALMAAGDQVERTEQRIRQAQNACTSARHAIDRATGMFDIWHASSLQEANRRLQQAVALTESDPDQAITLAHEATRIADDVYRKKQRNRHGGGGFGAGFASGSMSHGGFGSSFGGGGGISSGGGGGGGGGGFGGGGSSGW